VLRGSARDAIIAILLVFSGIVLAPASAGAKAPEMLEETFVDASFYSEVGCHAYTIDVMGAASTHRIARKVNRLASVSVSIFIFDRCTNSVVLSASGYQEVDAQAIRLSRGMRSGSLDATVPVFVPLGTGYYVDVPVALQFHSAGKAERVHRRWDDCSQGACVHCRQVGGIHAGRAWAEVILPPLQGVLFAEPINLTPGQSVRASATHLVTTMR
jgi:hypothetical protein